jgi:hypothetical protein
MVRFRTRPRTRVSQTVKVGPFRLRLSKPLGRGRMWGSVGTRAGRRGRLTFSSQLGKTRRRSSRSWHRR